MNYQHLHTQDIDALAAIVSESFNMPPDKVRIWMERAGWQHWRTLRNDKKEMLGGLLQIPMAQWFGGCAVPMTGLVGVAISPRARGCGAGQSLMKQSLVEMREQGAALSALYGSTTSFYRQCGYERAGACYRLEVKLRELNSRAGPLDIRPLAEHHKEELEKLQEKWVRDHASLKRGAYLWHRVRNPRGAVTEGVGFFQGQQLQGYAYFVRSEFRGLENEMQLSDLVLTTYAAQQTFLGFLAGHRAFYTKASWRTPASTPLLLDLNEPWNYKVQLEEHWMLRILDIKQALESRGYPQELQGELTLEIDDPLISENSGQWLLKVADGRGELSPGSKDGITTDIKSFASLYSGFLSAQQLKLGGRLDGEASSIDFADKVFRGEPRLSDFF